MPEVQEILGQRISDLGLSVESSPLGPLVQQLYAELERKKIRKFRPACYLSDEWGCPSGEPIIGIPFYLADARLAKLEAAVNDLESNREIMMYLRHEAGHAFNYAYELYRTPEWNALFGSFRRAYRDDYRATPFSRDYVRYLPGWYAQKHPDEDFAETFAVWLTPRSGWRTKYKNWGAMAKLNYVERVARSVRDRVPVRPSGEPDLTTDEMQTTVAEFYEKWLTDEPKPVELPGAEELAEIFGTRKRKSTQPAADVIAQHRTFLAEKIAHWTGVQRPIVKRLIDFIHSRATELNIRTDIRQDQQRSLELAIYATVLALTNLHHRTTARRRARHAEPSPPSLQAKGATA
jgi:hypothetical protein